MSLFEKCSVYNQPSVYNQGGGGGGVSTFDIDLNGEKNTLFWSPYLTPVEYIDSSDYTGSNLSILMATQLQLDSNDEIAVFISYDRNKCSWGNRPFYGDPAIGVTGSNNAITCTTGFNSNYGNGFSIYYGNVQTSLDSFAIHEEDKVCIKLKLSNKTLYVSDEHGNTFTNQSYSAYNTPIEGAFSVFGLSYQNPTQSFHGKFYMAYIRNGNKIKAAFVPARNKENNQPYIVNVANGAVGVNQTNELNTVLEFGPDIDLSEIQDYFT